jgi:hypothetical protein
MYEFLQQYKIEHGCIDCGYKENPNGLDFDHVRGDRLYTVGGMQRYGMKKVLAEIKKCEIRCGTCHNIRTRNGAE